MIDTSVTGVFDNEVHYLLKNYTYDGNIFYLLDLSASNKLITGNKAWKLKYNLTQVKERGFEGILTFGGAYSNHIYQTAILGKHFELPMVGLIRGEINDASNPTLLSAKSCGMQLVPIDRTTYRSRNDLEYLETLQKAYPKYLIIPEGGTNDLAIKGTTDLGRAIDDICNAHHIEKIAIPVATGGTMAGIVNGTQNKHVIGYGALRGDFISNEVSKWLEEQNSTWIVEEENIFGGYARWQPKLIQFIKAFHKQTKVILDPIYTGKMMYKAWQQERLNTDVLYIHTGGVQGNQGFNQRFELDLPTT